MPELACHAPRSPTSHRPNMTRHTLTAKPCLTAPCRNLPWPTKTIPAMTRLPRLTKQRRSLPQQNLPCQPWPALQSHASTRHTLPLRAKTYRACHACPKPAYTKTCRASTHLAGRTILQRTSPATHNHSAPDRDLTNQTLPNQACRTIHHCAAPRPSPTDHAC